MSFIDYLSGRQFGIYPSSPPPSYRRKSTSYFDIYTDEFNRALARESVNRFFHPPQPRMKNNFNNISNPLVFNRPMQKMQRKYLELELTHAKNA
jgi:hypothetical protein